MTTNELQGRSVDARTLSRRGLVVALAAVAGASASGCSIFSGANKPAPNQYWLESVAEFEQELAPVRWQLLVKPVTATMGLDTVKIAKRNSRFHIEYFEGAVWSETAPRMVQMLAIEGFENSGGIKSVAHEDSGVVADYILQLDLRDFSANATSGNTGFVNVDIGARLIWLEEAEVVASERFAFREYYGGTGDTSEREAKRLAKKGQQSIGFHFIVEAFAKANEAFCTGLVEWTLAAGSEHAENISQAKAAAAAAEAGELDEDENS